MSWVRQSAAATLIALLSACASSPQAESARARDTHARAHEDAEAAPFADSPHDPQTPPAGDSPLAADPYQERPGAEAGPQQPAPEAVPFVRSVAAKPVDRSERPALPERARLAVAFVRQGQVRPDAKGLLELERQLSDAPELGAVLGLRLPDVGSLDLIGLAASAREQDRDLLLLDVVDDDGRCGYVLHAESGALLARYEASERGVTVASGPVQGLLARLERTYARWTAR